LIIWRLIKKIVLMWDPDFTKVTLFERISLWKAQRAYARGEYYTDADINWGDD